MHVALRRRQIGMSGQFLNSPCRGTPHRQVRAKAVPQHVGPRSSGPSPRSAVARRRVSSDTATTMRGRHRLIISFLTSHNLTCPPLYCWITGRAIQNTTIHAPWLIPSSASGQISVFERAAWVHCDSEHNDRDSGKGRGSNDSGGRHGLSRSGRQRLGRRWQFPRPHGDTRRRGRRSGHQRQWTR